MERIMLHTRLAPGMEEAYERVHARIPDELDELLRESGVHAWRIYREGRDLFHYVEVDDYATFLRATADHPVNVAWQQRMQQFLEVAHDYHRAQSNQLKAVWELP